MPFDGAGTASIVNSFTPSTTISSSQVNANFTDIASMLTNTLPRDGQAGMTGQLMAADGSLGAPGLSFTGDPNTGFRRSASGTVKYVADGADAVTLDANGLTGNLATLTTRGDVLVRGASASQRLALGTVRKLLQSDGTDVVYDYLGSLSYALASMPGAALIGGYVTASVGSSALTIAVKTTAAADPAAATPVVCLIPDETIATGLPDLVSLTAATSLVIPSTALMGTTNGVAFHLWVVLFNNGEIGAVNCYSAGSIMPLDEGALYSPTAVSTGSDSAQVIYTTSGATNKPFRIIARLSFESGQATAGTWASAPTRITQAFKGMKLPGDTIQIQRTETGAVATGTTVTPDDDTTPLIAEGTEFMAVTITPRSKANLLRVRTHSWFSQSADTALIGHLHNDDSSVAIAAVERYNQTNSQIHAPLVIDHTLLAPVTTATEFELRAGPSGAATITFNGKSGNRFLGGILNSFMEAAELQT